MSLHGVDISVDQQTIDFGAVKQSCKVDFVYAKASEGLHYDDALFQRNHDMCKVHGIPFGAYHFFHFSEDPVTQAQHFLTATDGRLGQLIPMVDVEADGQDGVTDLQKLIQRLASFLHVVEPHIGKRMIIYADYGDWNGFMQGTDSFSGHALWVAEYNSDSSPTLPNGFSDYALWQYTSGLVIPGIPAFVDGDRTKDDDLKGISL